MFTSETKRLTAAMDAAESYEEWRAAAIAHDQATGVEEWVDSDESKHFDHASIRRRLERLRRLRRKGDHNRLLFALNEGIHGNIDGMGRRALYGKAMFGTKRLIMDFVDEVVKSLEVIASDEASDGASLGTYLQPSPAGNYLHPRILTNHRECQIFPRLPLVTAKSISLPARVFPGILGKTRGSIFAEVMVYSLHT